MAKQIIGIGNIADDGRGDTLRTAGDKINANFTEVYNDISTFNSSLATLSTSVNNITVPVDLTDLTDTTDLIPADVSDLTDTTSLLFSGDYNDLTNLPTALDLTSISTDIIPDTNIAYDLGSSTNRFRDLYLSGNTIYIGDTTLTASVNGGIVLPPYTTIPNIAEYRFRPFQVNQADTGRVIEFGTGTVIDQLTYTKAQASGTATTYADPNFVPSAYGVVIIPSGLTPPAPQYKIAQISIVNPEWYNDGDNGETVNTDSMVLLPGTVDITNPGEILNAYSSGGITLGSSVVSEGENTVDGPYTPADTNHWTAPYPQTIKEAIDRLAAALYAANGGTGI
jgi:hypothetical protein